MIKLTKKELEALGENKDAVAQLLVRKAILAEMEKKEYTEEEKKYLEEMKLNMEIEFYLNSVAQKTCLLYTSPRTYCTWGDWKMSSSHFKTRWNVTFLCSNSKFTNRIFLCSIQRFSF